MRRDKGFLSALLVLALLVTAASLVQAPRDKKTLMPTADSDVNEEEPDWNTGRQWYLSVHKGTIYEMLSFLMFDLSEISSGATLERAELRLYANGVFTEALVSAYYCSNNDWTEEEITYNNKPAFSPDPIDTANVTTPITWYEWNATDTAKSAFEADDKRLSLVLKADTRGSIAFNSRNNPFAKPPNPDTRPQLVVWYEAPPPSGIDPVLTALILIGAIGAVAVGLGLSYIFLKRRKPPSPQPSTSH